MRKAFDLRPLDFSDVLGRSFSLYMANFVGYLRWMLLFWLLPMLSVAVLFYFALEPYAWANIPGRENPSYIEANPFAIYYWLLKLAALGFAFTTGASGIYYMTARVYVGGNPGLGEVMRAVYRRFGHVAGVGLLHTLALAGITLGCIAPPFVLWAGDEEGMAVLAGFVLWSAWIPVMLWYWSAYCLNTPAVMLDDAEATEAYQRSAFLTKRSRMRMWGLVIVTMLIVGAPGLPGVLSVPGIVGRELLIEKAKLPLLAVVVDIAWDAVLLPLFFIPLVVYYFDMRCRKESYDLAVMARNFGIDETEMARFRFNPGQGYLPKGWSGERARRQKHVRLPAQRVPARQQVGPWGPQPGITGGWPQQQPFDPAQGGPQWPQQQQPQWPQQQPQWPRQQPFDPAQGRPQWPPPGQGPLPGARRR